MLTIYQVLTSLLSKPIIFNLIRKIVAGNQSAIKDFVRINLKKYQIKSVLDVGCGTGDYLVTIPATAQYVGIDISRQYLSFAKKHFQADNRQFLLQDACRANFYQDKKFDAVILISIMHHLSNHELSQILSRIKKVNPKVVILTDIIPNPPSMMGKILAKLDRGRYVRPQTEKIRLVEKYFKVVYSEMIPERLAVQLCLVCEI